MLNLRGPDLRTRISDSPLALALRTSGARERGEKRGAGAGGGARISARTSRLSRLGVSVLAVRCGGPGEGGHGLDAKTQCTHTTLYFTEPEPLGRSGCAYTLSELRARGHDTRHTHACYGTQIYIKCTAEIGAPRRLLRRNGRPHNPALARAFSTRPPAWHPAWRAAPSRRRAAAA